MFQGYIINVFSVGCLVFNRECKFRPATPWTERCSRSPDRHRSCFGVEIMQQSQSMHPSVNVSIHPPIHSLVSPQPSIPEFICLSIHPVFLPSINYGIPPSFPSIDRFTSGDLSIKISCHLLINSFILLLIHLCIYPSVIVSINHVTHLFIHPFISKVSLRAYSPHGCVTTVSIQLHCTQNLMLQELPLLSLVTLPYTVKLYPPLLLCFLLFPQMECFMVQSNSTLPKETSTTTTTNNNSI